MIIYMFFDHCVNYENAENANNKMRVHLKEANENYCYESQTRKMVNHGLFKEIKFHHNNIYYWSK